MDLQKHNTSATSCRGNCVQISSLGKEEVKRMLKNRFLHQQARSFTMQVKGKYIAFMLF